MRPPVVYDPPARFGGLSRSPDAPLEAMPGAWRNRRADCDDPAHNIRRREARWSCCRRGLPPHGTRPRVQVRVVDTPPHPASYPRTGTTADLDGEQVRHPAVVKFHFLPGTIRRGDRSTKAFKELCYCLGTEMLSLHARRLPSTRKKLIKDRGGDLQRPRARVQEPDVESRFFAYRAVNNEISHLREPGASHP